MTGISIVFILGVIGIIIYGYFEQKRIPDEFLLRDFQKANFPVIANVLGVGIENDGYETIQGNYKGRAIVLKGGNFGGQRGRYSVFFRVMPLRMPRKHKLFIISYPRPTRNTECEYKTVNFDLVPFLKACNYQGIWDQNKVIEVLDELIQAAEIVENDRRFFKGEMGQSKNAEEVRASVQAAQDALRNKPRSDYKRTVQIIAVIGFLISMGLLFFVISSYF